MNGTSMIPLLSIAPKRNHVNQYGFSVFDKGTETESFWEQVRKSGPLHILGVGTPNMFFVTRDRDSFERVKRLYIAI